MEKLTPIEYYLIYSIDLVAKSLILIVLSPALLITYMYNLMWRSNIKINDTCFYYSLNNNRIDCQIVKINKHDVVCKIKGTYNQKTIHKSKLNKISL